MRSIKAILLALALGCYQLTGLAAVTYYHNDLLGSPVAATNESGTVVWRAKYYPYGDKETTNASGSSPVVPDNTRYYTSHEYDEDTGLIYMQARYYDPVVGRFMGVDPVGFTADNPASFNRYLYVNNNPYRYVDPDGRFIFPAIAFIWGVIEAALSVADGVETVETLADPNATKAEKFKAGGLFVLGLGTPGGGYNKIDDAVDAAGDVVKRVEVPRSKYPEGAAHIEDAQAAGQPSRLTIDKSGASSNRAAAQSGQRRTPGMDLDEYPPAMFREGGAGASVRPMTPSQNRGMGSCIGNQCRNLPDGTEVDIVVVD